MEAQGIYSTEVGNEDYAISCNLQCSVKKIHDKIKKIKSRALRGILKSLEKEFHVTKTNF